MERGEGAGGGRREEEGEGRREEGERGREGLQQRQGVCSLLATGHQWHEEAWGGGWVVRRLNAQRERVTGFVCVWILCTAPTRPSSSCSVPLLSTPCPPPHTHTCGTQLLL